LDVSKGFNSYRDLDVLEKKLIRTMPLNQAVGPLPD